MINASPEAVWRILTDTGFYPDWNPFLIRIEGAFEAGARLAVTIQAPNSRPMIVRPTCLERAELRIVRWRGSLGVKGLFDGEHIFELEPDGSGATRFIHRERFTGALVALVLALIGKQTRAGFEAMNLHLKMRAEGTSK